MQLTIAPSEISAILAQLAQIQVNPTLAQRLDLIEASLSSLLSKVSIIMSAMDNLKSAVAAETSIDTSAVTLIQGIATQLQTLAAQKSDTDIQALADQLTASTAALSTAVTANTPAASPAPTSGTAPTA